MQEDKPKVEDWLSYMTTNLDAQEPGKCCSDAACLERQKGLCTNTVVEKDGKEVIKEVAAPNSDFALITCPTNEESTCGSTRVIIPELARMDPVEERS